MKNPFQFISIFAVILLPVFSWAQSYQLGNATYTGLGCPAGSLVITVSPDGGAISVLFNNFRLGFKPGYIGAKKVDCQIRIPMTITPGYMLEANSLDYRGFIDLPNRANSLRLTTAGVLNSGRLSNFFNKSTEFVGPKTDSFTLTHLVPQTLPNARKCNTVNELKLNVSADITSRGFSGEFSLDSADIGSDGLVMAVMLKPCNR